MATKVQAAMDLAERLEAIIAHPEKILDLKDNAIRRRLREAGRKLSHAMEDSGDTTHRIANAVSHPEVSTSASNMCTNY